MTAYRAAFDHTLYEINVYICSLLYTAEYTALSVYSTAENRVPVRAHSGPYCTLYCTVLYCTVLYELYCTM